MDEDNGATVVQFVMWNSKKFGPELRALATHDGAWRIEREANESEGDFVDRAFKLVPDDGSGAVALHQVA